MWSNILVEMTFRSIAIRGPSGARLRRVAYSSSICMWVRNALLCGLQCIHTMYRKVIGCLHVVNNFVNCLKILINMFPFLGGYIRPRKAWCSQAVFRLQAPYQDVPSCQFLHNLEHLNCFVWKRRKGDAATSTQGPFLSKGTPLFQSQDQGQGWHTGKRKCDPSRACKLCSQFVVLGYTTRFIQHPHWWAISTILVVCIHPIACMLHIDW